MIKITHVVRDIISEAEIPLTALQSGYLNLSAYAKSIHKEVARRTKKPVKLGSVVVALTRLRPGISRTPSVLPVIKINKLAVRSNLVEIAFDRTQQTMSSLRVLYKDKRTTSSEDFYVTQGTAEITVLCTETNEDLILKLFKPQKPKAVVRNLVGLTVRLSERSLHTPNTFYALVRGLAVNRISIVGLISTYTELTLIIEEKHMQKAFNLLHKSYKNRNRYIVPRGTPYS